MTDDLEEIRKEKIESLKQTDGTAEASDDVADRSAPVHVESQGHLQDLVGEGGVVLVDFYADWCGPCKMLEPTLETLAADTEATVAKVDVDEHQQLAGQYQVRGVPTVVVYSDGEAVEQFSGVRGENELRGLIQQYA
jgi:thioredoxin 1